MQKSFHKSVWKHKNKHLRLIKPFGLNQFSTRGTTMCSALLTKLFLNDTPNMTAFHDNAPCSLIESDWHFLYANCLHH